MSQQVRRIVTCLIGICIALALAPAAGTSAQTGQRCFAETRLCIAGRIRQFWEQNGGLPVFGLPKTPQQATTIEGRSFQAQWFERARLELHPENSRPYDVLLGRLGVDLLAQQGRDWQSFPKVSSTPGDLCFLSPATGHVTCGDLFIYFRTHGLEFDGRKGFSEAESIALFGLPISEAQTETIEGKPYTVQWFERARLELHPENEPPYNVLGGLLGNEIRAAPAPAPGPIPAATGRITYLDPDGATIKRIQPDGGGQQVVFTISKQADEQVASLSADRTGTLLLYSLLSEQRGAEYYLIRNGAAKKIGAFASTPRWSPNGTALVAQAYASPGGGDAAAHLYDIATDLDVTLGFSGVPDWFPDGGSLVYVAFHATGSGDETADIFRYDVLARKSAQLTNLSSIGGPWTVQQAHVLPDSQNIIFFGGQPSLLGASGNGQQWWWVPVAGGTPAPFDEPDGNGVTAYAANPGGDMVGYATGFHVSACMSAGQIAIRTSDVRGGFGASPQLPELNPTATSFAFVKGISWSPDTNYLAFASQPANCPDAGHAARIGPTSVYVWSFRAGNGVAGGAPRKLVEGSFPAWTQ